MDLEAEYQHFVSMAFAGQKVGKVQMDAMRDAFFAGALVGCHSNPVQVATTVAAHIRSIKPCRPESN